MYINVQGDEPLLNPLDLKKMINFAKKNPNKIANGYAIIDNKKDYFKTSIPKVIFNKFDNKLLYMSRAGIPANKNLKFETGYRQICIYSFPYNIAKKYSKKKLTKKTFYEKIEDIEILRFLENGDEVHMIKMSTLSKSVDLPSDVKEVEKLIKSN